jgi:hypothetical protein
LTVDIAAAITIDFTGQLTSAGDSVYLRSYSVTLDQAA